MIAGGGTTISDPGISYVTVLGVVRENGKYYPVVSNPVSSEYSYTASTGTITFSYGVSGDGSNDIATEKVIVIYKL